jgi:hypothetical protein
MDIVYGKNIHESFHESIITLLLRFDRCPKNDQRRELLLVRYTPEVSAHLDLGHISKTVVGTLKSSLLSIDGTREIQRRVQAFQSGAHQDLRGSPKVGLRWKGHP